MKRRTYVFMNYIFNRFSRRCVILFSRGIMRLVLNNYRYHVFEHLNLAFKESLFFGDILKFDAPV